MRGKGLGMTLKNPPKGESKAFLKLFERKQRAV